MLCLLESCQKDRGTTIASNEFLFLPLKYRFLLQQGGEILWTELNELHSIATEIPQQG